MLNISAALNAWVPSNLEVSISVNFSQFLTKYPKSVTCFVLNFPIFKLVTFLHPKNILLILSTLLVSKFATFILVSSSHEENIASIFVTSVVSKLDISKLVNFLQLANILSIFSTFSVLKDFKSNDNNSVSSKNIFSIFITLPVFIFCKLRLLNFPQLANMLPISWTKAESKFDTDKLVKLVQYLNILSTLPTLYLDKSKEGIAWQ